MMWREFESMTSVQGLPGRKSESEANAQKCQLNINQRHFVQRKKRNEIRPKRKTKIGGNSGTFKFCKSKRSALKENEGKSNLKTN